MSKHSKGTLRYWKMWAGIVVILLIMVGIILFVLRNKMTPEETVSKFMYLVENKQYEEAKKLCSNELEKLDVVSTLKPSNLTFSFSEDKKEATSILLENETESTNMNLRLKNTLMGWKIDSYEVVTGLINPQIIEDRLKQGENVSDIQLLYWGESEVANKEEITEYANSNGIVAMIFAETMKAKKYEKALELYQPLSETDLTVEQLKSYNWNNYKIENNLEIITDFNGITVNLDNKKIYIYVARKTIINIIESKT